MTPGNPAAALRRLGAVLVAAGAVFAAAVATAALEPGFSRSVTPGLVTQYRARFGGGAPERLASWQRQVREVEGRMSAGQFPEPERLAAVNGFFNRVPAGEDQRLWGQADYWATPAETLSLNAADCEDYAIGKYFTLKELGVPIRQLRLVYVHTWLSRTAAHLVLAYFPTPDADPLILDNLQGRIQKASDRPDLTPVFSFNDEDLTRANLPGVKIGPRTNRRWAEVIDKLDWELTL